MKRYLHLANVHCCCSAIIASYKGKMVKIYGIMWRFSPAWPLAVRIMGRMAIAYLIGRSKQVAKAASNWVSISTDRMSVWPDCKMVKMTTGIECGQANIMEKDGKRIWERRRKAHKADKPLLWVRSEAHKRLWLSGLEGNKILLRHKNEQRRSKKKKTWLLL